MLGLVQDWNTSIAYILEIPQCCINSSPPNAAYMHQWIQSSSVKIMACRLLGPSQYLNQCWVIVNWTLRNKLQWNFDRNSKLSIHENAPENIGCEMAAILSRGRWVKPSIWPTKLTLFARCWLVSRESCGEDPRTCGGCRRGETGEAQERQGQEGSGEGGREGKGDARSSLVLWSPPMVWPRLWGQTDRTNIETLGATRGRWGKQRWTIHLLLFDV